MFTGGTLLIQLKDMRTNFALLKLITRAVMKFLDLDANEKNKLVEQTFTQDNMEEFIINFFTGKLKYHFKKEQKSQFE